MDIPRVGSTVKVSAPFLTSISSTPSCRPPWSVLFVTDHGVVLPAHCESSQLHASVLKLPATEVSVARRPARRRPSFSDGGADEITSAPAAAPPAVRRRVRAHPSKRGNIDDGCTRSSSTNVTADCAPRFHLRNNKNRARGSKQVQFSSETTKPNSPQYHSRRANTHHCESYQETATRSCAPACEMQGLKPPSRASSRLVGADRPAYDESMRSPKRKKYVRLPTPAFSRDPTVSLSHTWLPASQRLAPVRRLLGMLFFAWRVCWEMGGIESAPWLHGLPCSSQLFSSVMHPT